ncbi:TetR family transcriptional regulator [Actinoplanes sp. NPDC051346]|uniref:TetR/AcrR family transcriptional regulator n=1 Tax=Actinoplanes sp. NPDC051346 TaxID=3155048 RepID=UPI003432EF48
MPTDRFAVLTDAAIDLLAERGMRGLTHRAVDAGAGVPQGTTSAYFRTRKALIEAVVRRIADLDRVDMAENRLPADMDAAATAMAGKDAAATALADGNAVGAGLADGNAVGAGLPDGNAVGAGLPDGNAAGAASADGNAAGAGLADGGAAGTMMADVGAAAAGIAAVLDRWMSTARNRTLARYACLLEATHHPELRTILRHGDASRAQARSMLAAAGAPNPAQAGDHLVACIDGLLLDRLIGAGARTAPPPGTAANRADLTVAITTLLHAFAG